MPLNEDGAYGWEYQKGPQANVNQAIVAHIGRNPEMNGAMQAEILLKDYRSGLDVEQNAIASQVALQEHGDRMSEEVRNKLQQAITTVLAKWTHHRGPQDPVTNGIVDFVGRNPVVNGGIQADILASDYERGMDVAQNALGAQAALEEHGEKMPQPVREKLRSVVERILNDTA